MFSQEILDSFMKKETYNSKCHQSLVKRVNDFCIG